MILPPFQSQNNHLGGCEVFLYRYRFVVPTGPPIFQNSMDEDGIRQRQPGAPEDDTEPLIHSQTRPQRPLSFWESIKASLMMSLVGLIIFFGGIGLQFWNEVSL